MPELIEVERYRQLAGGRAVGRLIAGVDAPDGWYLKRGADPDVVADALVGGTVLAARRRGKLMMLDVGPAGGPADAGPGTVLGLHFGMSGRLLVDGEAGVDRLLYAPAAAEPRYERFALRFADGGRLVMSDPRRLGGVELDPDLSRLGPDALDASPAQVAAALTGARVALKARLLDQSRLAGVGNLIADEVLWRAGLDPRRIAGDVPAAAVRRLARHLSSGIAEMGERGGSHTGDLMAERRPGGRCPRDGTELRRATVGGRTTWWCPRHQR